MEYNNLIMTVEGAVATVAVNRPKALNALNQETLEELLACFTSLAGMKDVRVVILTGAGEKSFVAGADIAFMKDLSPMEARNFALLGQSVFSAIENLPQPVIAAINGFSLGGGCELALSCDMRIASETAKFGQPEVNLGVIPGFAGTQRLPRLIGKGLANELLFTGDIIDAQEACRIGLVNRVVPADQLMPTCQKIAGKIASKGPLAVKLCKGAVNSGMEMELNRACQFEADQFALCFTSPEQKEGMGAFLEKRPAKF